MSLPIIDRIIGPKRKREIMKEIKQLNKKKARLEAEKKGLSDMGRDNSEIQGDLNEIEEELVKKYDELADMEYREALKGIEEKSREKKTTLTRVTGELREERKEVNKLEERLREAEEQIEKLKEDKKEMAKNINELEEKLRDREMRIEQKEGIIDELKGKITEIVDKAPEVEEKSRETTQIEARAQLLELILKKYADHVNESERRTIQEMRELIQPNNIYLREYLEDIDEEEKLKACEKAYERIMKEFHTSEVLPVEHWMNIKQMIDNKVCDIEDKAILLCSAFRHFEVNVRIAVTKLENDERRPLVFIDENNKNILIDPNEKHPFMKYYGSMEELKEQYEYKESKIKGFEYMFNDREYKIPEGKF